MENNIDIQAQELINKLSIVKEEFIRTQNELKFSIRKDVVASELKDLLSNNTDFYSLKQSLEDFIEKLYKME